MIACAGVLLAAACGTARPPGEAQPYRFVGQVGAAADLLARAEKNEVAALQQAIGMRAVDGGALLVGEVRVAGVPWAASWHVRGTFASGENWKELSVHADGSPLAYYVARVDKGHCSVSTSLGGPTTGTCDAASLALRDGHLRLKARIGQPPDAADASVELNLTDPCADWWSEELAASLAMRPGFELGAARLSWRVGGPVGVPAPVPPELAATSPTACCWRTTRYSGHAWIERRCPGSYGLDLALEALGPAACGDCAPPPWCSP